MRHKFYRPPCPQDLKRYLYSEGISVWGQICIGGWNFYRWCVGQVVCGGWSRSRRSHSLLVFVFPTFTSGTGRQSDLPDLHC